MTFLDRVLATISRHEMLETGDRVVVAVSGGPDSVSLLHALLELAPRLALSLTIAHLDHALRGEDSDADRRFVEELAARLGLPIVCAREDVAAIARAERRSIEEAGRRARRAFLRQVAGATASRRVCLGHHRDDQAESVLLRLVAGSGRSGLAGIRPVSERLFVRPLLDCSREEILAYLASRGIASRRDATNDDLRFPRNRMRRRVLPILREEFNPRVAEAISRTAALLREEDAWLDRAARRALRRIALESSSTGHPGPAFSSSGPAGDPGCREPSRRLVLDAERLSGEPAPIARRALRLALRRAGLAGRDLAADRIEEILDLARRHGENVSLSPGGGMIVRLEYGRLILEADRAATGSDPNESNATAVPVPGDRRVEPTTRPAQSPQAERAPDLAAGVVLLLPGEVALGPGPARVRARLVSPAELPSDLRTAPPWRAHLDADRLALSLLVRSPRPGDRFRPLGAPGARKLSDLFTDLKVPVEDRRDALVVESGGEIAWVVGLRIGEPFRVGETTRRVVRLEVEGTSLPSPRRPAGRAEGTALSERPEEARDAQGALASPCAGRGREARGASAADGDASAGGWPAPVAGEKPAVLYTAEEIAAAVDRLAREVSAWAAGREVTVLGVLQGSFIFLADLARRIEGPVRLGFLDRRGRPISDGCSPTGEPVLLVEDILDTGESLTAILQALRAAGPKEIRTCVLFDKPSGRKTPVEADFRGLLVPDRWVVGYGLDDAGRFRNLPYLTWVPR